MSRTSRYKSISSVAKCVSFGFVESEGSFNVYGFDYFNGQIKYCTYEEYVKRKVGEYRRGKYSWSGVPCSHYKKSHADEKRSCFSKVRNALKYDGWDGFSLDPRRSHYY